MEHVEEVKRILDEVEYELTHGCYIVDKTRAAKQICQLYRLKLLEELDECFHLAPEDDVYFRILVKEVTEELRTGKTRKQRADERYKELNKEVE